MVHEHLGRPFAEMLDPNAAIGKGAAEFQLVSISETNRRSSG